MNEMFQPTTKRPNKKKYKINYLENYKPNNKNTQLIKNPNRNI